MAERITMSLYNAQQAHQGRPRPGWRVCRLRPVHIQDDQSRDVRAAGADGGIRGREGCALHCAGGMAMRFFLSQHFQWYRRWVGGRWERHFIDICSDFIWLHMSQQRKWPGYRQPCSVGEPEIEDWPVKGGEC